MNGKSPFESGEIDCVANISEVTTPQIFWYLIHLYYFMCSENEESIHLSNKVVEVRAKLIFNLFFFFYLFSHRCDNRGTGEKCIPASCYRSCLSSRTGMPRILETHCGWLKVKYWCQHCFGYASAVHLAINSAVLWYLIVAHLENIWSTDGESSYDMSAI